MVPAPPARAGCRDLCRRRAAGAVGRHDVVHVASSPAWRYPHRDRVGNANCEADAVTTVMGARARFGSLHASSVRTIRTGAPSAAGSSLERDSSSGEAAGGSYGSGADQGPAQGPVEGPVEGRLRPSRRAHPRSAWSDRRSDPVERLRRTLLVGCLRAAAVSAAIGPLCRRAGRRSRCCQSPLRDCDVPAGMAGPAGRGRIPGHAARGESARGPWTRRRRELLGADGEVGQR